MSRLRGIILGILAAFVIAIPIHAADYSYKADDTTGRRWVKVSDTEWTMDVDGDGKADVILDSSLNKDGNQIFTYTFNVEDNEQAYYVYEQMMRHGTFSGNSELSGSTKTAGSPIAKDYTSQGSDEVKDSSGSATYSQAIGADPGTVDSKTHTYTITNTKSHTAATLDTGVLKITKNVTGDMIDPGQKFTFTITLKAPSGASDTIKNALSGTQIFGDVVFTDGTGKVSLGKGKSAEMTGIPAGVTYTITETQADHYGTPTKTNDTGTITKGTTIESVWTNASTYTPPVVTKTVFFHITKKVTGASADAGADYAFLIHLTGLVPCTDYTVTGDMSQTFTSDDAGTADVRLSLKKDQSVTVNNIPEGATYQVNETGGNYIPSYQITDAASKGKIVQDAAAGAANTSLSTSQETADDGEDVTVTFTNAYASVQNLTIKKFTACKVGGQVIVYGSDEYNALTVSQKKLFGGSYEMTVDFANLPEGTSIDSPLGFVTPDEYGEASKTFSITGDGSPITFHNIPAGVTYKITETANDAAPSYEITTEDTNGKPVEGTVVSKSATGKKRAPLSTAVESVEENESDTVTFTNLKAGAINFAVLKTDHKDMTAVLSGAVYSMISCTDGVTDPGKQTTGSDGYALWNEVQSGTYVLKETKAPSGYTIGQDYILVIGDDGTIRSKASRNAEAEAKALTADEIANMPQANPVQKIKNGLTYDVFSLTDTKLQELPNAGGDLRWYTTIAFSLGIMFAGIYLINWRKGKHDEA